jgi:hypothetical protein
MDIWAGALLTKLRATAAAITPERNLAGFLLRLLRKCISLLMLAEISVVPARLSI